MRIPSPMDIWRRFKLFLYITKVMNAEAEIVDRGLLPVIERLRLQPGAVNIFVVKRGAVPRVNLSIIEHLCFLTGCIFKVVEFDDPDLVHITFCGPVPPKGMEVASGSTPEDSSGDPGGSQG